MNTKVLFLTIAVCCAVPARGATAAASFLDKKLFIGLAGGFVVGILAVTYLKLRTMLSYAGNTPIGVVKIDTLDTAEPYLKLLQEYSRDPMIKGILLQIDSPGGAAGTSYILHEEIKRITKRKPVVAMIENGCYSGGYWVASAADYIIAAATAGIGSIGVISQRSYFNTPQRYELQNMGIISGPFVDDSLFAGQYKLLGAQSRALNESERAMLQSVINSTYDQVCADIAAARDLNIDERATWADGQIFMATQALKLKLIDQVGTVSDIRPVMRQLLLDRKVNPEGDLIFVQRQNIISLLSKAPLVFNSVQHQQPYKIMTEI